MRFKKGSRATAFTEKAVVVERKSAFTLYVMEHLEGCEEPNFFVEVGMMAEFGDLVSLVCRSCKIRATIGFVSKLGYQNFLPKA